MIKLRNQVIQTIILICIKFNPRHQTMSTSRSNSADKIITSSRKDKNKEYFSCHSEEDKDTDQSSQE